MGRALSMPSFFKHKAKSDTKPDLSFDEKATSAKEDDVFSRFGVAYTPDDELEILDYRKMMRRDTQVQAAVKLKIYARLSSGYDIVPADSSPESQEIADFVTAQFSEMRGSFKGYLRRAMMAMAYGLSVHEIVLRPIESGRWNGKIGLKSLKWKRPEEFRVKTDKFGNVEKLQQKDQDNTNTWNDLPAEYFTIWAYEHEGDYVGKSDLRPIYRWSKSKELIDNLWNIHCEKFATPTPIGKYPKGATQSAKTEMLNSLKNMHTTKSIVAPLSWEVELLEAKRTGKAEYEAKMKYCDRMIGRGLLIPSLLVDEGDSGAYALGKKHADNFVWVLDALGDELGQEVVEEQLIRFLVQHNFKTDLYPKFRWKDFDEVDLTKMSEAFTKLINIGLVSEDEKWIREKLELPPFEEGSRPPRRKDVKPDNGPDNDDDKNKKEEKFSASKTRLELKSATGQKFDAQNVKARFDEIEADAVEGMESAVRVAFTDIKKQLRKKKIVENKDLAAVEKMKLKGMGGFRSSLELATGSAVMWGSADAQGELEWGAAKTGNTMPDLPKSMGINLSTIPNVKEPIEFISTRDSIISSFDDKVPIQRAALAAYGRDAFTITGVYSENLLSGAKQIISKGIRRGASTREVEAELAKFFEPYLTTPGAVDSALASAYRIETIVRTNVYEAYNTGRMNLFLDPEVGNFIIGYEYSAILDDRTTEFCEEWDGKIFSAGSSKVFSLNPPNHHRCRSVLIPITRDERLKVSDEFPSLEPAKGFSFSCCGNRHDLVAGVMQ